MLKMEAETDKNQSETEDLQSESGGTETLLNELAAPLWSVVSFEKREAKNQTYAQAEAQISELNSRKVSGLCIITDEAAARMEN